MIFNRTANDIEAAKELRAKLQSGEDLTSQEVEVLERGTLTINTLNRIESKTAELKALFDDIGYFAGNVNVKAWEYSQIFGIEDFERILANVDALRRAYYVYKDTPDIPRARYHFQNINDIEKILFDLETMYRDMKGYVRECGTFECGEENLN